MINIKRGVRSSVPHPTALIPHDIVDSRVLRKSLYRLGAWVADHGLTVEGQFQAPRDLLLRARPRALTANLTTMIGENGQLTEAARKLAHSLPAKASVLPIQGPPGSGKTFTGARMIVELARSGRRVGITAASHKVISNLLGEVCKVANELRVSLACVQKPNGDDGCQHKLVTLVDSNDAVRDALTNGSAKVAAGSAWLWAREEMADSVDVLFVDEAGQMSLANVLAISPAATSIVLLGDPQQLDQP
jgi:uncharacterized protein